MWQVMAGSIKKAIIDYSLKSMKNQQWYDKPFFIEANNTQEFSSKLKSKIRQHDFVPLPIIVSGNDWNETTHTMTAYNVDLKKIRTFTEEKLTDTMWVNNSKPSATDFTKISKRTNTGFLSVLTNQSLRQKLKPLLISARLASTSTMALSRW